MNASDWPGGVVHESIYTWIDRQEWSTSVNLAAYGLVARREAMGLNPLTLAQWRSWAAAQESEPMNDEGCAPSGSAHSPGTTTASD